MATEGDNNPRHDATMPLTPPGARPQTSGADPLLGKKIDSRYELKIVLGEGGMGKVYLAEDTKLGRRVALKLMGTGLTMDPEFRSRFEREAVLQANLPHPQVIQIIDMGETPEGAFIVMEYSDGRSLARLLRELGPMALERALEMCEQILEVLDFAHGQQVVHRDLKPANILVEERPGREIVRLLDFGIAKLISSDGGAPTHTLTKQGFAYGTLGYMAPEQARGEIEKVDHRVDIYAIGVMLHEMLTGEVPAPPESRTHPVRYAMWVAENKVAPLSESHPELQIAEQVDDMMQKALRRDPDKRYQSAFAFRNAIKEFRQSAAARTVARPVELPKTDPISSVAAATASPPATRGGGWLLGWIAAGVLAVLGGVAGFLYLGERSQAQESERQLTKVATAFSDLGFDGDVDAGLGSLRSRLIELEEAAGTADPAERAALDARIVKLKKDVETAAADRDAARGELAARQATLDAKELELGKARGDLTRVESQLETANKQLEGLRNAVNPDTAELSEARQRITELKGNVGDLQTSVKVLEGEKTALEKEKGALEAQLSLSGESARKVVELEGKISALEGERDTLRSEKASTESARKALEVRNGELESSNADNRKKLEDVRGELATARRARDTLDAEVKGLRADNARLENSSGTSAADREELARLRSVEARLKSQVVDANKRVTELQDENRRLKARRGLPLGRPFNVILHNAHKSDVRINEVVASGAYGTRKVAVPTKDKANEVSLGKDLTLAVPGGTTRILVRFYRRHYANRRWQIRTIELKATVSPSRVKVLVK